MPTNLPPKLLDRACQIIEPFAIPDSTREALLTEAFFLYDPIVYSAIEREGNPRDFTILCVKQLLIFACRVQREHALARLLSSVRARCGSDKHAEIDDLIATANAQCEDGIEVQRGQTPALTSTPTTVPTQTLRTPLEERRPTVFVSYSHEDEEFAQKLITDLNAVGHSCWIDSSEIKGGDEWIQTISDGIINSYAFVPIISLRALQSSWVRKEILWAIRKQKRILPVLLEDVMDDTRYFPLVDYQIVNLFENEYSTQISRLVAGLPGVSGVFSDEESGQTIIGQSLQSSPSSIARNHVRKLELSYLDRLRLEELVDADKYIELAGTTSRKRPSIDMRVIFEKLNSEGKEERFENAVDEIKELKRCVILGEPGAGKTKTIWKLASDLVTDALSDPKEEVPLLFRLVNWTDDKQSLRDFMISELGDLGPHLDTLLAEERVIVLLDGLNELPASQRAEKYRELLFFLEDHSSLMVVLSCRKLDYKLDMGLDRIEIIPMDPLRIREFVTHYLEEPLGSEFFWKLAGEGADKMYEYFQESIGDERDDIEMIFWSGTTLPAGDYWGLGNEHWYRWLQQRDKPSSMLALARNPYMLLMLTNGFAQVGELPANRGQLFAGFVDRLVTREIDNEVMQDDEKRPLQDRLARLAYSMQMHRLTDRPTELTDPLDTLTALPKREAEQALGDRLLYLAGSTGILDLGEQIRFSHQLLQEYFVARYMADEIQAGRLRADDIWQPDHWWEPTNWEEATILLAGMYPIDSSPIVRWVMEAQPELAVRCIVESGATTPPDETLLVLRNKLLERTKMDIEPVPKTRAIVGRALDRLTLSTGEPLDNRKGISVIPIDGQHVPDIDWVLIQGGTVELENAGGTHTCGDFYMARYPITNAQFAEFLPYANDDKWWTLLPEDDAIRHISDSTYPQNNHPRVNVNWYQAVAYIRWLQELLPEEAHPDGVKREGWAIRLPKEWEWQLAATGGDTQRIYPYGAQFDSGKGNTLKTRIDRTCAVGLFEEGASSRGVEDLSGNVWEWCLNKYEVADDCMVDASSDLRVSRGGSWYDDRSQARCTVREPGFPSFETDVDGFRLVFGVTLESER